MTRKIEKRGRSNRDMTSSVILVCDAMDSSNSAGAHMRDLATELSESNCRVVAIGRRVDGEMAKIAISNICLQKGGRYHPGNFRRACQELSFALYVTSILFSYFFKYGRAQQVICYSPPIFVFFPLIFAKCLFGGANTVLLLRDFVPQWWVDTGIIKDKFVARLLFFLFKLQLSTAGSVLIQSESNILGLLKVGFSDWRKVHVVYSWMKRQRGVSDSDLSRTSSFRRGKNIEITGIYAGAIGPAQDIEQVKAIFTSLVNLGVSIDVYSKDSESIGGLLKDSSLRERIQILDVIPSEQMQHALNSKYDFGIFSLNSEHTTSNIPGKVVAYVENCLPSFGVVNDTCDLPEIMEHYAIGSAVRCSEAGRLNFHANQFIKDLRDHKYASLFFSSPNGAWDHFSIDFMLQHIDLTS